MLIFDTALANILDAVTSQTSWVAQFKGALTVNRTLRCFKDSVEFLNASLTGVMSSSGGSITSFGVVSNVTVQDAVDISSGGGVLSA